MPISESTRFLASASDIPSPDMMSSFLEESRILSIIDLSSCSFGRASIPIDQQTANWAPSIWPNADRGICPLGIAIDTDSS